VRRSSLRRISSSPESSPRFSFPTETADPTVASEFSSRSEEKITPTTGWSKVNEVSTDPSASFPLRRSQLQEVTAQFPARLERLAGIRLGHGEGSHRDLVDLDATDRTEGLVLDKDLHLSLDAARGGNDGSGQLDPHRTEIVLHPGDHGPSLGECAGIVGHVDEAIAEVIGLDRLEFGKIAAFSAAIETDAAVAVEDDGLGGSFRPRIDSDETCRIGDVETAGTQGDPVVFLRAARAKAIPAWTSVEASSPTSKRAGPSTVSSPPPERRIETTPLFNS
jgi:hypothetical protein